ncbi:hypothetical protein D3C87_35420 [compost metagenome]
MKNIGIQQPCSEDWSKMTPTEKGAFCQKCAKQVHDFTKKSNSEIKQTLLELKGQEVCGRMTIQQEIALNMEFEAWIKANKTNFQRLFITALLIVFGLTLFSCEDERDQRKLADAQIALSRATDLDKEPETLTGVMMMPWLVMEETPVEVYEEPIPELIYLADSSVYKMEEVEIMHDHEYYVTSGIMISSIRYVEYIEETAPIETDENGVPYPTAFKAFAFPNPAVENTTIEIQAPEKEYAEVHLYDLSGKLIREVYSGEIPRGAFRQQIDLNDLNSGLYLVIIRSADFKETVRIVKN